MTFSLPNTLIGHRLIFSTTPLETIDSRQNLIICASSELPNHSDSREKVVDVALLSLSTGSIVRFLEVKNCSMDVPNGSGRVGFEQNQTTSS